MILLLTFLKELERTVEKFSEILENNLDRSGWERISHRLHQSDCQPTPIAVLLQCAIKEPSLVQNVRQSAAGFQFVHSEDSKTEPLVPWFEVDGSKVNLPGHQEPHRGER